MFERKLFQTFFRLALETVVKALFGDVFARIVWSDADVVTCIKFRRIVTGIVIGTLELIVKTSVSGLLIYEVSSNGYLLWALGHCSSGNFRSSSTPARGGLR